MAIILLMLGLSAIGYSVFSFLHVEERLPRYLNDDGYEVEERFGTVVVFN